MSNKDEKTLYEELDSISKAFTHDKSKISGKLFEEKEFDIYVNKITKETYIFHAKPVKEDIKCLVYNPKDHRVTVVKNDGTHLDLGAKIQWLVRPHFIKSREIGIIQTKDGEPQDGFMVPLITKES